MTAAFYTIPVLALTVIIIALTTACAAAPVGTDMTTQQQQDTFTASPASPAWNDRVTLTATSYDTRPFDTPGFLDIGVDFRFYRTDSSGNETRIAEIEGVKTELGNRRLRYTASLVVDAAPGQSYIYRAQGTGLLDSIQKDIGTLTVTWPSPTPTAQVSPATAIIGVDRPQMSWTALGNVNGQPVQYQVYAGSPDSLLGRPQGSLTVSPAAILPSPASAGAYNYWVIATHPAFTGTIRSNNVRVDWIQASVDLTIEDTPPTVTPLADAAVTLGIDPMNAPPQAVYRIQYSTDSGATWQNLHRARFLYANQTATDQQPGDTVRQYRVTMHRSDLSLDTALATSDTTTITWQPAPTRTEVNFREFAPPLAGAQITLTVRPANLPAGVTAPWYHFSYRIGSLGQFQSLGRRQPSASITPFDTANRRAAYETITYQVNMYASAFSSEVLATNTHIVTWQPVPTAAATLALHYTGANGVAGEPLFAGQPLTLVATPGNAPSGAVYNWYYRTSTTGRWNIITPSTTATSLTPTGTVWNRRAAGVTLYYRVEMFANAASSTIIVDATTSAQWQARPVTPQPPGPGTPATPTLTLTPSRSNPVAAGQSLTIEATVQNAPTGWRIQWRRAGSNFGSRTQNRIVTVAGQTGLSQVWACRLYASATARNPVIPEVSVTITWAAADRPTVPGEGTPPPADDDIVATITASTTSPAHNAGITLTGTLAGASATGYTFTGRRVTPDDSAAYSIALGSVNQSSRRVAVAGQPGGTEREYRVAIRHSGGIATSLPVYVRWREQNIVRAGRLRLYFEQNSEPPGFEYQFDAPAIPDPLPSSVARLPYNYSAPAGQAFYLIAVCDIGSYSNTRLVITCTPTSGPRITAVGERRNADWLFRLPMHLVANTATNRNLLAGSTPVAPPSQPANGADTVWQFSASFTARGSGGARTTIARETASLTWHAPTSDLRWTARQDDVHVPARGVYRINLSGATGGRPPYRYEVLRDMDLPNALTSATARRNQYLLATGAQATDGASMGTISGRAQPHITGWFPHYKVATDQDGNWIWDDFGIQMDLHPDFHGT